MEEHDASTEFQSRADFSGLHASVQKIKEEFSEVIVGQHAVIELLITAVLADGHVLIEGVPGVAKTLMAKTLARTLDTGFNRIQFTPDLMPSDVRSEEHTSELQSLMRISNAVFCLKKK